MDELLMDHRKVQPHSQGREGDESAALAVTPRRPGRLDPSNGQDGSRDQHHADGTGVVGADGIPIVVPDGPTQAQSLVQATRPAREIIGEWLPRLQAVRDAWATTLPAEAESEWPRGAAYVRESSINSLSGDAPDIQLRNVLALLTHRRVYVAPEGVFFDVQSGTDVGPRASFRRLFEQAIAGGFKVIGVFLSERLFRNLDQSIQYKRQFRLYGVEIVYSGKYEGDQRNPSAWQLEVIQDMTAELHARNTGYYVGTHMEMLSRAGRPVGKLPEAYRVVERAPNFMGRRGSAIRWEAAEPLAQILREGLTHYLDGMSCTDLAAWSAMTELKGRTPAGRVMDKAWWYDQLRNPRFAGYQVPTTYTGFKPGVESPKRPRHTSSSELVPCLLPPLWTLDDYHTVRRLATERMRAPKKRRTYRSYLMSGIAYHASCGHRVGVTGQVSEGRFWLECKALRTGPRHSETFRGDIAEKELDVLIGLLRLDDAGLRTQIEEELRKIAATADLERERFRANPAIASARQALAALGHGGIEDLRAQLAQRLEELEAADAARRETFNRPVMDFRRALRELEHWALVWASADMNTKNKLLREADVRVEIGRLPGDHRKPAHLLSIGADNPVFALALATGLAQLQVQHRDVNSPVDQPMLETIRLSIPPEVADAARRIVSDGRHPSIVWVRRPKVVRDEGPRLPNLPGGPWLPTFEFADRAGLSRPSVSARVRRGKLRGVRVQMGNGHVRWLVAEEELASVEAAPVGTEGYLTPSEFGARTGLSAKSVTGRVYRRSIRGVRSPRRVRGSNWLIPETEVEVVLGRSGRGQLVALDRSPRAAASAVVGTVVAIAAADTSSERAA